MTGATALGACTIPLPERDWWIADIDGVEVVTDWDRDAAERLVVGLAWFRLLTAEVAGVASEPTRGPASLLVLATEGDYRRFAPNPDVLGFLTPSVDGVHGLVDGSLPSQYAFEIACHELVHILLAEDGGPPWPDWYNEGLANYLSALRMDGNDIVLGESSRLFRSWAGADHSVSVSELLESGWNTNVYRNHRDHLDYHGSAEDLVRWIFNTRPSHRPALERYLRLWRDSVPSSEAFELAFGAPPDEIDARMRREEADDPLVQRLPRSRFKRPRVTLRSLRGEDLLVRLSAHAELTTRGRAWLLPELESALAADARSARLRIAIADLLDETYGERWTALIQEAIELEPLNPDALSRWGDYWRLSASGCDGPADSCESRLDRAIEHYQTALSRDRWHPRAMRGAALARWERESSVEHSSRELDRASRRLKTDPSLQVALAEVSEARGDLRRADAHLRSALALMGEGSGRALVLERLEALRARTANEGGH